MMKPKIIVDCEREHIVRYWEAGKGKGSYPTIMFEVIINTNFSIYNLECLINIFKRAIDDAKKERKNVVEKLRNSGGKAN